MRSATPKRSSARNQRLHAIEEEVVKLGPRLAADLDGVLKARGSDERDARAFALQQRIRADRGAVQQSTSCQPVTRRSSQVPPRSLATDRPAWRRPSACARGRARIQTQSVKVPPVSTATRVSRLGGRGMAFRELSVTFARRVRRCATALS